MAAEKTRLTYRFEDPNPRILWEMALKNLLLAKLLALREEDMPE